ncbi:MAG TPA: YetF domain-containing protein [Allocoleopsis sp.]
MSSLFSVEWRELFVPNLSLVELFIRGSLVYLVLFAILRSLPSRQLGSLAITDLLVVVLFAEAAQNAMARDYTSITEGAVLIGSVIFWSYALNWLGFRFPVVQQFLNPPPLLLVKQGHLQRRNMRRELITEDELMSQLRQQGIESVADVKAAYMEADGTISVIPEKRQAVPYRVLKR